MSDKTGSHFTIGEFAQLFGVSKQTLFYYEKNNIFAPNYVADNGYRYYSIEQYFVFEIIITLRKLDVPLKRIKDYVNHRNSAALQKLFADKALEYELQIELLHRNRQSLSLNLARLQEASEIKAKQITLENSPAEYYVAADFSAAGNSLKDQIRLIASHNLPFATSEIFNEYGMGFIVPPENLPGDSPHAITRIFTRVSHLDEYPQALTKPKGLYAKIITPDGYHTGYQNTIDKLLEFIRRNDLTIVGNAYIVPLKNYWSTNSPNEYVTQIAIHVAYQ